MTNARLNPKWLVLFLCFAASVPVLAQSMSINPGAGSGQDVTFTVYGNAPAGNVGQVWLLLQNPACQVTAIYGVGIYIMGDSGSWSSGTGSNSVCQLNGGGFNNGGSSVSVNFSLHFFLPAYAGLKSTSTAFSYNGGTIYGWQEEGVWTPNPVNPPSISGSGSGSGTSNTFSFSSQTTNYAGPNAPSTIYQMYLSVTDSQGGQCTVTVADVQGSQALYLMDSTNSYWQGPISPGSLSLSNNYCQLSGAGSGASGASNATANFSITFLTGFSAGQKSVTAAAIDSAGADSWWQNIGQWTIPSPSATLTFNNNTRGGSTMFYVGDSYQVQISGTQVNQAVTLNYTKNGGGSNGVPEGSTTASGFALNGVMGSGDVGDWVEQWFVGGVATSPASISFSVYSLPSAQFSHSSTSSFEVGESYTVQINGFPNQPVTLSENGVSSSQGSTNPQGSLLVSRVFSSSGTFSHTWYVNGVPTPSYSFVVLPTPGNSISGSFTAPDNPLASNDLTGGWNDTLPGASAVWNLTMSGSNVQGSLTRVTYQGCSAINYSVTGTVNGTTATLAATQTASPPIDSQICGSAQVDQIARSFQDTVSLSGRSCSSGTNQWTSAASQASGQGTSSWTAKSQHYWVSQASYIPVDHIQGPTPCSYAGVPYLTTAYLLYKGDAFRNTYRTTQSILLIPDAVWSYGFYAETGPTRNYSINSPANGLTANLDSTLIPGADPYGASSYTGRDEDQLVHDCQYWNDSGHADKSQMQSYSVSFPSGSSAQVALSGVGKDPLEPQFGGILWSVAVTVDDSNPSSPTASGSIQHSC